MSDSSFIVDVTRENFQQVMEASFQVPVLVDFWASWCQPCQVLMPVLAKLADEYQGKFLLAKLDTEQEQEIAAQFGIRSIPNCKLFRNGQPVDEFMGALPEKAVREFLDRHLPRESDATLKQAEERLAAGNADAAIALLTEARAADPEDLRVVVALAEAQLAKGDTAAATALLDDVPPEERNNPNVARVQNRLFFASRAAEAPAAAELEARIADDAGDHEAQYQLALQKIVAGDYEGAMELLLQLMKQDRTFEDDAGRRTLLRVFELLGDDPLVHRYRRRMANLLY